MALIKRIKPAVFITVFAALVFGGGAAYHIIAAGGVNGTATSTANNLRQPIANTSGLVAWYPLDGDAKDYSGNHNDGTLTNFTFDGTTNGWTGGKFGQGLLFNGSNTYISVPDNAALRFGSAITLSAWVKIPSGADNPALFAKNNTFYTWSSGGKISFRLFFSSSTNSEIYSTHSFADNNWHLYTATYDGSTQLIYQDANTDTSKSYAGGTLNTNTNNLMIGNFSSHNFLGTIDDARIYNRALSAAEIAQLYAGSSPANCDQTCKSWLKLDDNTGTSASDSVSGRTAANLSGSGSSWTGGNFASAVSLDGSTGSVSVPDLASTSGTVELWVNPSVITGDQRLFSQASGASTQAGQIALNQSSGESGSLWVWDGSAWQRLAPDGTVKAGQWNQIVVANNGSVATAYVNGTRQLTAASAFAFSGVAATLGGKFLGTAGGTFNGAVDDFRLYSRYLAPEEVAEQWRQGT